MNVFNSRKPLMREVNPLTRIENTERSNSVFFLYSVATNKIGKNVLGVVDHSPFENLLKFIF